MQWMADRQHARDRLNNGWHDINEQFVGCKHCNLFVKSFCVKYEHY